MLAEMDFSLVWPALLAGLLVLTTHVPLGQEVLKRGIIFIDLAIAQIAALGVIAAHVFAGELNGISLQLFAAISAFSGAMLIYQLEKEFPHILEALIGLLFILAASGGLLLISHAPDSDALIHDLLVGQILWVTTSQLIYVAALYTVLLLFWFRLKEKRHSILFYIVFSLAVTASVQLVGVYLVFASLILPALATRGIKRISVRLMVAYLIGFCGYLTGLLASLMLDVPMGAMTVWTLFACVLLSKLIQTSQLNINLLD